MTTRIEFFFDPICPFCWVTSRWVVEVAKQRPLEVTWRPVALRLLNEGISYEERQAAYPEYPDSHQRGLEMLRVVHAARERHGDVVVGDLYTALGELVWDREAPEGDDFGAVMHEMAQRRDVRPALRQAGLEEDLAEALDQEWRDDDLRAETKEASDRCGGGVGTPIISFAPNGDGSGRAGSSGGGPAPALFGPVIDTIPTGDEAVRLWDAVDTLANWRGFAELKRSLRSMPATPLTAKVASSGTQVR